MMSARKVFTRDIWAIRRSVMTALVVCGLVVIPMFFSVFNVLASWDPFSRTNELKIAVASTDEGYKSDLAAMDINIGDQVLAQLSRNHQIDWIITSEDEAIEGTKSGEYYASIVLPENFSKSLLSFYVTGTKPTELELYTNQKKNALSTVITSQGADGVINQINANFTQTVSSVGIGVVSSLDDYLNESDTQASVARIQSRVDNVSLRLHSGAQTVRSFADLLDTTRPLVNSAGDIARAAGAQFDDPNSSIGGATGDASGLETTLGGASGSVDASLNATAASFEVVGQRLDALFANADSSGASVADTFDSIAQRVQTQTDGLQQLRDTLDQSVGQQLPAPAKAELDRSLTGLDAAITRSTDLQNRLRQTSADIRDGGTSSQSSRQGVRDAIDRARNAVVNARSAYNNNLRPQLEQLGGSLNELGNNIATVRQDLDSVKTQLGDSPGSLDQTLSKAQTSARNLADKLEEQSKRFADLENELANAGKTGDFARLSKVVGSDPEALASQLATPVSVSREAIYPVASFGAGMLPLYTTLALWIGALLTAVLVRPEVTYSKRQMMDEDSEFGEDAEHEDSELESNPWDEEDNANLSHIATDGTNEHVSKNFADEDDADSTFDADDDGSDDDDSDFEEYSDADEPAFSPAQSYFGRYGIFALIGVMQAILTVVGLLAFAHAGPQHPFLLLLTCVVTALVFMLIVYTLVLSFGSAGKAISVFLLVIQISSAGGAYPLQVLPEWFQRISGWLPATHAINAMRSAMAGIYQGDLWIELGLLLLFTIPALILGLVLRRFLNSYNRRINEGMARTKIMV
ncbi:YhgE/Pip domain-containing protein [uncultured Corynebacterium sp.]|uniref:YhgE/Pip domain-containing protein n=1 Tax=uncultured Corynebacterium sp. TaxID=159447 RepID=UPI002599632F|nr:YhgE/Pip domain-containing protein [uncultured Corynebacterium sp.]